MKKSAHRSIVPENRNGKIIDVEKSVVTHQEEEAKALFQLGKDRFLHINQWATLSGSGLADFHLMDEKGLATNRPARKGDFIMIDISGPGSPAGNGYDWVQIEEMQHFSNHHIEQFSFRVRPSSNPQEYSEEIAHFYSKRSTSTFQIARVGNKVTASVHDRNTQTNREGGDTISEIRDAVVGSAGLLALSKLQWEKLVNGIVRQDHF